MVDCEVYQLLIVEAGLIMATYYAQQVIIISNLKLNNLLHTDQKS